MISKSIYKLDENRLLYRKELSVLQSIRKDLFIYLLMLPALLITFVFSYIPMPGILVAFKNYDVFLGPFKSSWSGLKHIKEIFELPAITQSIFNTLKLSVLWLVVGFPAPIVLALMFNELKSRLFKRVAQTLTYLPYFLSWISVIGISYSFFSMYGPLNDLRISLFGPETERIMYMAKQNFFIPDVLLLGIWKETGWNTVIYLAAIASINIELYEAANIDGANKFQQLVHITLPGILPTSMILLILNMGGLFNSNFELVYGLQNAFIDYEVISTVVFKYGIQDANYSMATAIGFLQGIVALILILTTNKLSKKISSISIW